MHATAIVTDAAATRSGPLTAGFRDVQRRDTVDPGIEYADSLVPRAFGICRQTFADRNVDRRVESTKVDIPSRHPRDANVDPVAICLDSSGLVPGMTRWGHLANALELLDQDIRSRRGTGAMSGRRAFTVSPVSAPV